MSALRPLLRARLASRAPVLARASSSSTPAPPLPRFAFSPNDPTPEEAAPGQSPNVPTPWSRNQNPKPQAFDSSRLEQVALDLQPDSLSAMGLVEEWPVVKVKARSAVCDGGKGALGHPKIFINLDKPGPRACGYCGTRYEQDKAHH